MSEVRRLCTPPPTNLIGTTTTLLGRVNPHSPNRPPTVTFTAIVSPASGTVAPGGTVDLIVNGRLLGRATVRVVNGVAEATFTVVFFGRGSFTFDAQYEGSSDRSKDVGGLVQATGR